jgi:proline iminopeptidase
MMTLDSRSHLGTQLIRVGEAMKPLVVVHGGPGLDHSYLRGPLSALSEWRSVFFYDQYGCAPNEELPPNYSPEMLIDQLLGVAKSCGGGTPVDAICHSWGAFLLYGALARTNEPVFNKVILISPVGLTRERFDRSGERLIRRIPVDVLERIEGESDGTTVMATLCKYYMSPGSTKLSLDFKSYRPDTFDRTVSQLGDYDFRDIGEIFQLPPLLLYGEADIEIPDETAEIHSAAIVKIIDGAGHFCFAERPDAFLHAVREFLIG